MTNVEAGSAVLEGEALSLMQQGQQEARQGNPDRAVQYYTQASLAAPQCLFIHAHIGRALAEQGALDKARRSFKRALGDPKYGVPVRLALAQLDFKEGDYDSVGLWYAEVLLVEPGNEKAKGFFRDTLRKADEQMPLEAVKLLITSARKQAKPAKEAALQALLSAVEESATKSWERLRELLAGDSVGESALKQLERLTCNVWPDAMEFAGVILRAWVKGSEGECIASLRERLDAGVSPERVWRLVCESELLERGDRHQLIALARRCLPEEQAPQSMMDWAWKGATVESIHEEPAPVLDAVASFVFLQQVAPAGVPLRGADQMRRQLNRGWRIQSRLCFEGYVEAKATLTERFKLLQVSHPLLNRLEAVTHARRPSDLETGTYFEDVTSCAWSDFGSIVMPVVDYVLVVHVEAVPGPTPSRRKRKRKPEVTVLGALKQFDLCMELPQLELISDPAPALVLREPLADEAQERLKTKLIPYKSVIPH